MPENRARLSAQPKLSRGRPRKADILRLIKEGGAVLSDEFRLNPIRHPVDPPFLEFYERLLKGDWEAIFAYVQANRKRRSLDASFYEVVGRLVFRRFFRVVHEILSQLERNPVFTRPNLREKYKYWYGLLKPLCDRARGFILTALVAADDSRRLTRERLWHEYLSQYKTAASPRRENDEIASRNRAIEKLIEFANADPQPSLISQVIKFRGYGLVPREVFLELATTTHKAGRRMPQHSSKVARHFACKIIGISESTVSHWDLRKK